VTGNLSGNLAMGVLSAVAVAEIKARGSIKDADVLRLRRNYDDDGRISAEEAEIILALNDACPVQDPTWADCLVETITDYVVEQAEPHGYITAENARWLIARISRDGRVETKTELALILNVLDKARWAPQSYVRFALDQVKQAVIGGNGPLRSGKAAKPGIVTEGDVELIRRMLGAFGGDGNLPVTQPEAEVLFDIDEATAAADNHPVWPDLFVKAIASSVMGASGHAAPPRAMALARDAWLRRGDLSLDDVLGGMVTGHRSWFAGYHEQSEEERAIARLAQQKIEIVTREPIAPAEADWLASRIGRGGTLTPNQRALLAYLKSEILTLHPTLHALVEAASLAA
jgi:hypothetical protein